jgi:aldehyde decarbonylase
VGDGLDEEEQLKAQKGTLFIPFSQFPPKKLRKDCSYHSTPAMVTPRHLENLHSCEVSKESTRKFKIINILLIYLY